MTRAALAEAPPPEGAPRWFDRFLSEGTCRLVLEELATTFWKPSSVVGRQRNGSLRTYDSSSRVSETAYEEFFSPKLRRKLRGIETEVAAILGAEPARFEHWQATRYRRGGRFDFHFDAGYWAGEAAGDREKTVLIYLEAPRSGGGTRFKELGIEVRPRAGRLLIWDNLLPGGERNPRMLHAAVPVAAGRKTVLVTWIRQRAVRLLRQEACDGPRDGRRT